MLHVLHDSWWRSRNRRRRHLRIVIVVWFGRWRRRIFNRVSEVGGAAGLAAFLSSSESIHQIPIEVSKTYSSALNWEGRAMGEKGSVCEFVAPIGKVWSLWGADENELVWDWVGARLEKSGAPRAKFEAGLLYRSIECKSRGLFKQNICAVRESGTIYVWLAAPLPVGEPEPPARKLR